MTYRLTIQPEAELDLAEAYRWYEKLRPGLGAEFLDRVEAVFEGITASPEIMRLSTSPFARHLFVDSRTSCATSAKMTKSRSWPSFTAIVILLIGGRGSISRA